MKTDYDGAVRTCEKALNESSVPAEFTVLEEFSEDVGARDSRIETPRSSIGMAVKCRVISGGFLGFSFTKNPTPEEIGKLTRTALVSARARKMRAFQEFPEPRKIPRVKAFDESIKGLEFSGLMREFSRSLSSQRKTRHVSNMTGAVSKSQSKKAILNNSGLFLEEESAGVNCYFECTATDKGNSVGSYSKRFGHARDVDFEKVAQRAVDEALECLNPSKLPSGEYELLLDASVLDSIIAEWVLPGMSGDTAMAGKSYLSGKIGEKVFSESLSLEERPFEPFMSNTCAFDDEGLPTSEKGLVRKGVVRDYFYDLATASKKSRKARGNGFAPSESSEPVPSVTNVSLAPGKKPLESWVSEAKSAVVVTGMLGMHDFNTVTGDFSVVISSGYAVENGQRTRGVTGMALSSNVRELLKGIEFSRETETVHSFITPRMARVPKVVLG